MYLYKYIYKGPNRVSATIDNPERDETKLYLDARNLSPPESCHRLFGFKMHDCNPPVVRLALHLEGEQVVTFRPSRVANMQQVLDRAAVKNSSLVSFYQRCAADPEARDLTYIKFPTRYVNLFPSNSCRTNSLLDMYGTKMQESGALGSADSLLEGCICAVRKLENGTISGCCSTR